MKENNEPTEREIKEWMIANNETYYCSREALRELAYKDEYKDKSPNESWGDYFKGM